LPSSYCLCGLLGAPFRLWLCCSKSLRFTDADLEKLYVFAKLLWRLLPVTGTPLPVEVQQNIDLDAFRLRKTSSGTIKLKPGAQELEPMTPKDEAGIRPEDIEPLSRIIHDLNERFGTDFTEDDKVFIRQLEERIAHDPALAASIQVNPPEDARLTFNQVVNDKLQDMVDSSFKFYKQITDNPDFAEDFLSRLFGRYVRARSASTGGGS
jgi:type I restriction enzyme, R subunit